MREKHRQPYISQERGKSNACWQTYFAERFLAEETLCQHTSMPLSLGGCLVLYSSLLFQKFLLSALRERQKKRALCSRSHGIFCLFIPVLTLSLEVCMAFVKEKRKLEAALLCTFCGEGGEWRDTAAGRRARAGSVSWFRRLKKRLVPTAEWRPDASSSSLRNKKVAQKFIVTSFV